MILTKHRSFKVRFYKYFNPLGKVRECSSKIDNKTMSTAIYLEKF